MSKAQQAKATTKQGGAKGTPAGRPAPATAPELAAPRMKPRRGLFAILLLAFLMWVGALLALYWQTVYPMRHPKAGTTTTAPA